MMRAPVRRQSFSEGRRHRCVGRASNPVGGAMRCRVGSTPIPLRRFAFIRLLRGHSSVLQCSPYGSTAARFEPICARSRRRLNAKPLTLDSSC